MTARVRKFSHGDWDLWCSSAASLPVTCHPGWAAAVKLIPSWRRDAIPFHIENQDGEALAVGYPRSRAGIDELTLSPLGLNAAFHAKDESHSASLLADFVRHQHLRWRSVGLTPPFHAMGKPSHEAAVSDAGNTHVLDLTNGYDEIFEKRFKGATRTCIRRSESAGVQVESAIASASVSDYYRLHRELAEAMGGYVEVYPEAVFHTLLERCDRAELLIARVEGRAVGGAIFLDDGPGTFYWHAAADRAFASAQPAYAILNRAITLATGRGKQWLNFGSSAGIESLVRFKESWGARPVPLRTEVYRNPLIKGLRALRQNALGLVGR